jgi:sec-independent protein translocase protein TatA
VQRQVLLRRCDGSPSQLRFGGRQLEVFMIGKLGLPEILIILAIALLIFGPGRLSELGKGLGEGIKNFKSAVKDGEGEKK